jgi:methylated-DNA-[protein]-cysteine S-methyltransferase
MPSALQAGTYPTPVGDLAVLVDPASGAVVCSHFGTIGEAARELGEAWVEGPDARVAAALEAWAAGDGLGLSAIPVRQNGTALQQRIWAAIREVPLGETATYGEIALEVGRPRAARAVGTACARNVTMPFTPCHRIVSASGIGGFGGAPMSAGTALKRRMIAMEAA